MNGHALVVSEELASSTARADPGIYYEGQVGVHKSMNIITKGQGGAQECSTMY